MKRKVIVVVVVVFMAAFFVTVHKSSLSAADVSQVVFVQQGDTLWSIAKENNPGMDIRKYIYLIQKENGLESTTIYPGQRLVVPK